MFTETLLESSPSRAPVLKKKHYFWVTAGAAITSLSWLWARAQFFSPTLIKITALQSLLIGAVVAAYGLMFCYVYAESRQLKLNTAFWVTLTCLMNIPGFVCFLIYTAVRTEDWKRAAVPCVYAGEVLLVGAMALVPLIYTEALPKSTWMEVLRTPLPPPPAPPFHGAQTVQRTTRSVSKEEILETPPSIPPKIAQIHDEPPAPAQLPPGIVGVPGGIGDQRSGLGTDSALINILRGSEPQSIPPQAIKTRQPQRIRVGGAVSAARLIYQPKPEYPELARTTRTEGVVEFEAVIGKEGTIEDLKLVKGHPLLVKAALEAVRQWRYQPTLLNGDPIEVVTEITVNFRLAE